MSCSSTTFLLYLTARLLEMLFTFHGKESAKVWQLYSTETEKSQDIQQLPQQTALQSNDSLIWQGFAAIFYPDYWHLLAAPHKAQADDQPIYNPNPWLFFL